MKKTSSIINKTEILSKLCYTELVYERINKKLNTKLSKAKIERMLLTVIRETKEEFFQKTGKNIYVTNHENNIRITINSHTFRVITVDRITEEHSKERMDRQEKIQINNIPAILYGSASNRLYLYVHGKHSRKEEAEKFANIAIKSGYQVLSFDLPGHGERAKEQYPCTAQNSVHDLNEIYSFVKNKYKNISLYACSLGAYFSLLAYRDIKFEKCLFFSPILNMERLIQNMMKWSNISKEELKEKGEHETSFGETLSWDYYEYVRNNPVGKWDSPTFILYGDNDNLTERCVLDSFVIQNGGTVDVMPGGEHYFHTKEQLDYLECWLETVIE